MLKPIHYVPCAPALRACRSLQEYLLAWLCDADVLAADTTKANLQPPRVPTQIEADWLWDFLQRKDEGTPLLDRARAIASMQLGEKAELRNWVESVTRLSEQFTPEPPPWPIAKPGIPGPLWKAFKELMTAFYTSGLQNGLPYAADGSPLANGGVTREQFVKEFRERHRLTQEPGEREVCVLCGDKLGQTPQVDHWLVKKDFPLLSVCADNILPICQDCNSSTNKGERSVHTKGSFADWFHPYFRPGFGAIQLGYDLRLRSVTCAAASASDAIRVENLNNLLNLTHRWTIEFKAEYLKQQRALRDRIRRGKSNLTSEDVQAFIQDFAESLQESEPCHEVHKLLGNALLEQARVAAWEAELGLETQAAPAPIETLR